MSGAGWRGNMVGDLIQNIHQKSFEVRLLEEPHGKELEEHFLQLLHV